MVTDAGPELITVAKDKPVKFTFAPSGWLTIAGLLDELDELLDTELDDDELLLDRLLLELLLLSRMINRSEPRISSRSPERISRKSDIETLNRRRLRFHLRPDHADHSPTHSPMQHASSFSFRSPTLPKSRQPAP